MHDTLPDWHGLLAAINPASPAGSDMHGNDLFLQIRDIRNTARGIERQRSQGAVCDQARLLSLWKQVAEGCCSILGQCSKDLDVCAWLIEAQTRLHDAQGLADSLMLYSELMQLYWPDLFPRPGVGEGAESCVTAIVALNGSRRPGSIVDAINNFNVTCHDENNFALWHYHAALNAGRLVDEEKRRHRTASLGYSLPDLQQAAARTETDFYRARIAAVESAQMALHRLDTVLTQKLGTLAPATSSIRDTLAGMQDAITYLAGARLQDAAIQNVAPATTSLASVTEDLARGGEANSGFHQAPGSRDEAIRCLAAIADYFRNTEPHSPLAYSIDVLARRARMPFDQLMRELIPDPSARDVFQLMTGVSLMEQP